MDQRKKKKKPAWQSLKRSLIFDHNIYIVMKAYITC